MKRFLIFAGEGYEPLGGFNDYVTDFSKLNEAIEYIKNCHFNFSFYPLGKYVSDRGSSDWCHIVDTKIKNMFEIDHDFSIRFYSKNLIEDEYIKHIIYKEYGDYEVIFDN